MDTAWDRALWRGAARAETAGSADIAAVRALTRSVGPLSGEDRPRGRVTGASPSGVTVTVPLGSEADPLKDDPPAADVAHEVAASNWSVRPPTMLPTALPTPGRPKRLICTPPPAFPLVVQGLVELPPPRLPPLERTPAQA